MTRILPLSLLLAACSGPSAIQLEDPRFATGSRTMVSDADHAALFAVNVDEGTVSRVDLADSTVEELDIGVEPTRIARAGKRYFVTLRGEAAVGVFEDSPTGLDRVETWYVGAEPFGIVSDEAGQRLWVTLSQQGATVELDAATGAIVNRWSTPGDPRWIARHPSKERIYVAAARASLTGSTVYSCETDEDGSDPDSVRAIPLPETSRSREDGQVDLVGRITGDLAVGPRGDALIVPGLYVDNKSQEDLPAGVDPTTAYYMNSSPAMGRFNAAIIEFELARDGDIEDGGTAVYLNAYGVDRQVLRSYPNAVTVAPDGFTYAVSMEGSDAVVMVGALGFDVGTEARNFADPDPMTDPEQHGFQLRPQHAIEVAPQSGPRSVVYLSDTDVRVHQFLTLEVQPLQAHLASERVRNQGSYGMTADAGTDDRWASTVWIADSALDPEIRWGRELFYSATDPRMVSRGAGVSCNTCHMDGRDDGLTWQLGPDVWQTPSLAGKVSETHPVTWDKAVPSVADEARATTSIRMGGVSLDSGAADLIARFVDHTALPDLPPVQEAAAARGREIFERPDVGCADCHNGPALTDNDHHDLYGLQDVNTPTLRGIGATAPYLHDGSAKTLREVLELSRTGAMGDTRSLSSAEMADLETYLRSL